MSDDAKKAMISRAEQFLKPLFDSLGELPMGEIVDIMEGIYAATEDNCAWYLFALKYDLPPMIATSVCQIHKREEEYKKEWNRRNRIPTPPASDQPSS